MVGFFLVCGHEELRRSLVDEGFDPEDFGGLLDEEGGDLALDDLLDEVVAGSGHFGHGRGSVAAEEHALVVDVEVEVLDNGLQVGQQELEEGVGEDVAVGAEVVADPA